MFPNLVHSRVARNGKMCAQELPKVANLAHSRVARNGQKWQCNCFQIWLILELPGMAMVCAQEFPKVAVMFCFQIWLFPWSCQEWQCIYVSKSGSFHAKNGQNWQCICFPGVARNGNGVCKIWKQIYCHFWQSLSTHLCHSWQLQDLETDIIATVGNH